MSTTSPLLLDGEFIAYYPALARRLGGQPMRAIIVQALWFRRDRIDDTTRISYEALGEMVGCSADTAKRQVKWLVDNGFMTKGRASSHDATSVFAISEAALTSGDTPASRANSSAGEGGSALSTRRIRTLDQGNVPSSVDQPIQGVRIRTVEEGNLPSSDQGNLPSSTTSKNEKKSSTTRAAPNDGFRDFWIAYPQMGYNGRKDDCRRIWLALPIEERRRAYKNLLLWKTSIAWTEHPDRIPSPFQWLDNETWLSDPPKQVPPPVKYLTVDDIRLPD